jgi:hypothetical protein
VEDELQVMPDATRDMRAFLVAQLHWERYRAARMLLVHLLAVSAVYVWLPTPARLRAPIAAACAVCFLGALFAGMMEWRWSRERNRRGGAFTPRGGRS